MLDRVSQGWVSFGGAEREACCDRYGYLFHQRYCLGWQYNSLFLNILANNNNNKMYVLSRVIRHLLIFLFEWINLITL